MLGPLGGRRVIDVGCGQGYFSRMMATAGASVVGVEPSERLIEYARRAEQDRPLGVRYVRRDLSRLGAIDDAPFDCVVANMVFIDIAQWRDAMAHCVASLGHGGVFVFSLLHPCWAPTAELTWATSQRVEITEYLQAYEYPVRFGTNYHRPLSHYLNFVVSLGTRITELAEPAPPRGVENTGLTDVSEHIPNYVVVRVQVDAGQ